MRSGFWFCDVMFVLSFTGLVHCIVLCPVQQRGMQSASKKDYFTSTLIQNFIR